MLEQLYRAIRVRGDGMAYNFFELNRNRVPRTLEREVITPIAMLHGR